jgi:hypothetical protein
MGDAAYFFVHDYTVVCVHFDSAEDTTTVEAYCGTQPG